MMSELVLSPSRVNTFERCQLQYAYRYLEGIVKPPSVAAVIGTATHKSVEADLKHKFSEGELLPDDAVSDAARDAMENRWGEIGDSEGMKKGEAVDVTVGLAKLHHTDVAPEIEPVAIERAVGIQISTDIRMTGHIDVVVDSAIRDTKTIGKTPSAMKGDHFNQGQLYAIAVMVEDGELPTEISIDYLVKNKKPKAVSHTVKIDERTAQVALDRLALTSRVIANAIETGDFLPAPADSWTCSEKWCGYWNECPFGAAKRVQA